MEMVLQNSSLSKYVSDTFIIMYYKKNSTINRHYIEKEHGMIVWISWKMAMFFVFELKYEVVYCEGWWNLCVNSLETCNIRY